MSDKIGVFDSGIGGLTVLHACTEVVDGEFYYYGDNGNAPYGTRSEEEIYALTRRVFDVFFKLKVDAAVVACNTATAVCIERLRTEYPFPVVGTEPAISLAAKHCASCLLLATEATLKSERLARLLRKFPHFSVRAFAPKGLVNEIERNIFSLEKIDLSFAKTEEGEGIVLGCTHFVYLRPFFQGKVFDGNEGIALHLLSVLGNAGKGDHPQGLQGSAGKGDHPQGLQGSAGKGDHPQGLQGNTGKGDHPQGLQGNTGKSIFFEREGQGKSIFSAKNAKKNICFCKNTQKCPKIVYLGPSAGRNKTIYEQMFLL